MDGAITGEPHVLDHVDGLAARRGIDPSTDPDGLHRLLVGEIVRRGSGGVWSRCDYGLVDFGGGSG